MPPLLRLSRGIDRVTAALGASVSWLVLAMVLVGTGNALARYAGRWTGSALASNGWLELQWYLFSLVFLLAAPDALRRNAHVRVDVLYGRLAPRRAAWIDVVGAVLFLLPFCVFGVVVSLPAVQASWAVWEQSPDAGGLPRWPLKTVIPVAFVLLGLQGVSELVKAVGRVRGPEASA
ncbi:MAG: TRAP transporter small permease subunit [Alphaproteobacteria bacterium]|nr:TRAP transporter small permease subunit [Alphaproteobacteria bacterium]